MMSKNLVKWTIKWVGAGALIYLAGCSSVDNVASVTAQTTIETTAPPAILSVTETVKHEPSLTPTSIPILPDCPDGMIIFGSEENGKTQHFATCSDGGSFVETVPDYEQYDPNYFSEHGLQLRISDDRHELILENSSGDQVRHLIIDPYLELVDASLSFDGNYVAYGFIDSNSLAYGLQVIDVENDVISTIFGPDEAQDMVDLFVNWIRWSPNSNRLLIYGGTVPVQILSIDCEMDTHICQGKIEGQPGRFTDQYTANPWSPDGTLIAYPCYTAAIISGVVESSHELCVQNASGEMLWDFQEEDLGVNDISFLGWSPDSNRLIFTGYAQGRSDSDIFIFSLSSASLLNLTAQLPGNQNSALWLP